MKLKYLVLLLLILPIVSANTLFVEFDTDYASTNYAAVQELNEYNYDDFYDGDYLSTGINVSIYLDNNLIESSELQPTMYFDYSGESALKIIYVTDELELEETISLCNSNFICEPCNDFDCKNAETSLSCSDCETSSKDSYCELENDGICDPDCELYDVDCDNYANETLQEEGRIIQEVYFPDEEFSQLDNDSFNEGGVGSLNKSFSETSENNSQIDNSSLAEGKDKKQNQTNIKNVDRNELLNSKTQNNPTKQDSDLQGYLLYLGIGLFVLLIIYIVIHTLAKSHVEKQQIAVAYSYVVLLRKQNYSDQQIKQFFLEKGYEEEFINKVLKTQDSHP